MEKPENILENQPKDISHEFETMDRTDFFITFLRSVRNIPELSITTDFKDVSTVRALKAFIDNRSLNQKRYATVRATREQYEQDINAFQSGVKWEEIK